MIDPQLIFQNPQNYLDYMTSQNPEGQYFDRKATGQDVRKTCRGIEECISAFTNSRGGLLVIGIQNDGTIQGLDQLSEPEYNSLVQVKSKLQNHAAQTKEFLAEGKKLLLFFVPEGLSGVCETIEKSPQSWIRDGANCLPLSQTQKEAILLERNKKWEQLSPGDFDFKLLNKAVFEVFKNRYLEEQESSFTYNDEEFALNIGAAKIEAGRIIFTNAGYVFFANNPAGLIPSVQVRFLRYNCESKDWDNPGSPNFDKTYDGCLPELLRKIRTFINQGAFFKTYTYRNPKQSGLVEEPELPPNAVEETIVNAIIHRDYNMPLPIECILYKDAFVVRSPGKFFQPNFIPTHFNLSEQRLVSFPRNPKIVQWSRTMVDENGQRFVKQLSEGHRTILKTMLDLGLPSPEYVTNGTTTVKLYNNYLEREELQRRISATPSDEFCNLFSIHIIHQQVAEDDNLNREIRGQLQSLLKNKLSNTGWFIDHVRAGRLVAHQRGANISLGVSIDQYLRIFPAYAFQIHAIDNDFYLSIDYDIQVINIANLSTLARLGIDDLRHRPAQVKYNGTWVAGIIEDFTEYYARIELPEFEIIVDILTNDVIPVLSRNLIHQVLQKANIIYPLDQKIKELSLASRTNSARERAEKILNIIPLISRQIFPLAYNGYVAHLDTSPVTLHPAEENIASQSFNLFHLPEPRVKFANNQTEALISRGLTQFGSFEEQRKTLEIVPFCVQGQEENMRNLLGTLQHGSMNFRGLEHTFGIRPSYTSVIVKPSAEHFLEECTRLLNQHPEWVGDPTLSRIFLIHVPEDQYPHFDWDSPYYVLKEFLLSKGIPVQMVDTDTLISPKYKDLNLSLNLMAKTGGIPWVLPNALPDADVFIGLSYTQYKDEKQLYRTLGYANVFNQYGQWQYYKGNSQAFDYEKKHHYLAGLVQDTLTSLQSLPENPSIHLHYSAKFNWMDKKAILEAAQKIRPKAQVTFVWVNTGHNIRLFDRRAEGNGSLNRGAYVPMGNNRFYLSTTGYTTVAKTLGTPIMLEVNVSNEPKLELQSAQHGTIARHLLALTKLNWASSQSISGEPVTIKYARDIARLSHAFLRRKGGFLLHPVLERTPWFI